MDNSTEQSSSAINHLLIKRLAITLTVCAFAAAILTLALPRSTNVPGAGNTDCGSVAVSRVIEYSLEEYDQTMANIKTSVGDAGWQAGGGGYRNSYKPTVYDRADACREALAGPQNMAMMFGGLGVVLAVLTIVIVRTSAGQRANQDPR